VEERKRSEGKNLPKKPLAFAKYLRGEKKGWNPRIVTL
jgi:hypothetical protein